ncbi:MAG: bifunctional DNA-formamidopyrimidine glycosylase/DNA-(apurinic or apyrimidinic site) lyase [Candidatus Thioglobus sp.]|jgi:formamidopyrimidine-DNA glycosylase|nr:DNA-formamidopyrimidine glycosylase [Gammaproteobacteria bacterium]MBQ08423.1 DNA-formamidopyrimidine glycosylase [Gammaproteobacteria bacterium]MDP6163872.1 bifunctional DNA-formamidopyrimidine glycosylase/DNA-(apurinic or apyrimidinic site) lyase [Candidatus Thioglobus sp.]HJL80514.1 bifunctional DNA-formamidopyrimidine glycosylase/DNA-(apurinic or apyrimidinic site) lyase [Gammaproteobacteria bacterium]HJN00198.1 bifunctional DNA-formamidopyrimidine glycosylase/DNA-(apurinic or apyrimidin|tara:strand:+ start:7840 stop:8661 length:822 start_codon:yes stop_codon:yes gene_type:complete
MPELPEVEVTKKALESVLKNTSITAVNIRNKQLRWPVEEKEIKKIIRSDIKKIYRRGKYIVLSCQNGSAILHLGMSGSIGVFDCNAKYHKHDHVEFILGNGKAIRLNDPRRFGCVIWANKDPQKHRLIKRLGVEPLEEPNLGEYLYAKSRNRNTAVKNYIMNSNVVVGVGNIYASESLFRSGINPARSSKRISEDRYKKLALEIKKVLNEAIKMGGTTLRNFTYYNEIKQVGYFKQKLFVYGKSGKNCKECSKEIKERVIGGRNSFFCPNCQT